MRAKIGRGRKRLIQKVTRVLRQQCASSPSNTSERLNANRSAIRLEIDLSSLKPQSCAEFWTNLSFATTEGEELTKKEKLKSKLAALEAPVGDPKRIALIAADLVTYFEKRVEAMDGKAMIVCMSRRICVDLFNALVKLRPEWDAERLKVVMTGSAEDGPELLRYIGNKEKRRKLENRFKDAKDPFKIVIVRDMWLTGFDASCLHTMYADKPMQGHGLMQAMEGEIIDVFTAAGLKKPDIGILSPQFLAEVRGLKHKNVAAELLEKLLKDPSQDKIAK